MNWRLRLWFKWYYFKPRLWVNSIKRGIRNLFSWFPLIWNDHDWDFYTLYTILIYKLDRMEEAIGQHGSLVVSDERAKQIGRAKYGLTLLRDNYFEEEAYYVHRLEWGPLTTWLEPVNEKFSQVHFERPRAVTPEEKRQERHDLIRRLERAGKLHEELKRDTFAYIAEHIEEWWD